VHEDLGATAAGVDAAHLPDLAEHPSAPLAGAGDGAHHSQPMPSMNAPNVTAVRR
jgi:hypothetical protein